MNYAAKARDKEDMRKREEKKVLEKEKADNRFKADLLAFSNKKEKNSAVNEKLRSEEMHISSAIKSFEGKMNLNELKRRDQIKIKA